MESQLDDSPILMTATIANSEIKYDLTADTDWTCSSSTGDCTRSWTVDKFNGEDETTFTESHLILKKRIAQECKDTKVGDVTVCIEQGHTIDFTCKYPLDAQTVKNTFDVGGHDTNVSKEGFGQINFKLFATENVEIGDTVNVEIEAVNKGLIWHSLQDCTVSKGDDDVSILKWNSSDGSLVSVCPNVLNADIQTATNQDMTNFSWTAFKWSTSTQNDVERQTIECKISLSKDKPVIKTPTCAEQQANKEAENDEEEVDVEERTIFPSDLQSFLTEQNDGIAVYNFTKTFRPVSNQNLSVCDEKRSMPILLNYHLVWCAWECDNTEECVAFNFHLPKDGYDSDQFYEDQTPFRGSCYLFNQGQCDATIEGPDVSNTFYAAYRVE